LLAPQSSGADGDLSARQLNASLSLSLKGTVPARRLVIPRPHEDPALDNHDPDAGVAVLGPGADTEDLGLGKLLEYRPWESSCGGDVLKSGFFGRCGSPPGALATQISRRAAQLEQAIARGRPGILGHGPYAAIFPIA
jgi:hypothetical protein